MDPERSDPPGIGNFQFHMSNYMETARLIIGLASASIAGLAIYVESVHRANPAQLPAIRAHAAWPLSFFAWTVIYGVIFSGLLSWRYEAYCHKPSSYTNRWYALNAALGFSALICFGVGYASFAIVLLAS